MSRWIEDCHKSGTPPTTYRLLFGAHVLVVHRWRDAAPDQWLCSCYTLGVENVAVGEAGCDVWTAQDTAVRLILSRLNEATSLLEAVTRKRRARVRT
jgi:hypothetical protein